MAGTISKLFDGLHLHYENGVGGFTEQYLIENLTASNDPADLFVQAFQTPGCPQYRDPHPTVNGVYATTLDARPHCDKPGSTSKTAVLLEVLWGTPTFLPLGGQRVRVGGSNAQYILNRWPNGSLKGQAILVGYNPSGASFPSQIDPSTVANSASSSSTVYDTVQIPIDSPNALLQVTRAELTAPQGNLKTYRRMLNAAPWMGFDPLTVLCRQITMENMVGVSTIAPSYWMVDYYFEIVTDPKEWVHVEFFRDIHTGKPIAGTNIFDGTNNGYTLVQKYNTADFNGLKFTPLFV